MTKSELQRENERRFHHVAELLPQLVWTCTADGPCDYLSPQWIRYTGKGEAEQLGYGWLEQVHPDDRSRVMDQWRSTAAKGESFEIEFRILRHDGSYRWFRTLAVPLRDGAGQVVKWFGSNTDIDDLKRAEAALRESEQRYRTLFDRMTEGFALHEIVTGEHGQPVDYRFLDVNPAFERLTGLKRTALLGKRVLDVLPGTEADWIEKYGRVALTGEPVHFDAHSAALGRWFEVFAYRPAPRQFAVVFSDISAHRNAEAEVRQLARQRQLALDAAKLGWWHYNPITRVADWDDGYRAIFGFTGYSRPNDEILQQIIHPEDLPALWTKVEAALDPVAPQPFAAEYRIQRTNDGQVRWIEAHGIATFEGEGADRRAVDFVGTVQDITERKLDHERLRRQRAEIQTLLENTPAGLVLFDATPPYKVLVHNRYYQELFPEPFRSKGMAGLSVFDYAPAVEAGGVVAIFDEVIRTKQPKSFRDFPYRSNPPTQTWFNWHMSPLILDDQVVALVSMSLDVTERHLAEEALRQSREDLDRAQAVGQIGWWRLDTRKNVLTWSPENHRIFGVAVGTPMSYESFLCTVHPDDRQYVDTRWQAGLHGDPYDIEHRIVADGRVKWVREKAYLEFDGTGALLGGFGITQDITARKQAEEALRRLNETLEQRVAERTAEVQHLADRLRALATELTQTEQRERHRLAQVLHNHIQQLLATARLQLSLVQRGDPALCQTAVQAADSLVGEALTGCRSLTVELCPPVLHQLGLTASLMWLAEWMREHWRFQVRVNADKNADPAEAHVRAFLFEAVRELLLNAAKHSGIREADLTMALAPEGGYRIVVEDKGGGFDPASSGLGHAGGFGLFSIQQRLMSFGGRLQVESAPGAGTRVTLSMPAGREPVAEAPAAVRPDATDELRVRSRTRKLRLLLADDHQIMRQGLASLLQLEGDIDVVAEAEDGRQAVALARQYRPDVVVMDVSMPVMNGIDATREIRREMPDVSVIGLSMFVNPDVARAMSEAGAATYLTKGGPWADLVEAIRACGTART